LTARECALFRLADFDPLTDALPLQLAEVKPGSPFRLAMPDGERGAAEEILAKYLRLVVVADGGAGKTTLARRWACALAERALADTTASVPVYVEMNLYQQGELHELIATSAELDADTLQAELYAGRFALILDGLNEVAADAYTDAVRELRTLLGHDNSNRVLVTTRKHAYKDDLRLPTFAIEPLREDDIKAFVAARLGSEQDAEKAVALATQLLADARLRSLAENPMMLTMLTAIVGQAGDLPRNRGQLVKAFVDGVFAWEEQSLKAGETRIDRVIKEACLAAIAYRLTGYSKVAEKLTVGNWIADKLDELRLKKFDWTDVYGELLRNGLLVESGQEMRFFHEVGQEYFAALELGRRFTEGDPLTHVFNEEGLIIGDPWGEVLVMLSGIMEDSSQLVSQIINHLPAAYAGNAPLSRCILYGAFTSPRVKRSAIAYLYGVADDDPSTSSDDVDEIIKELFAILHNEDDRLNEHDMLFAAEELARIGPKAVFEFLLTHLPKDIITQREEGEATRVTRWQKDTEWEERLTLLAYGRAGNPSPLAMMSSEEVDCCFWVAFGPLLTVGELSQRVCAIEVAYRLRIRSSAQVLAGLLNDEEPVIQFVTIRALGDLDLPECVDLLAPLLNTHWREQAIESMLMLSDRKVISHLLSLLTEKHLSPTDHRTILLKLVHWDVKEVLPFVREALRHESATSREVALEAIAKIGTSEDARYVIPSLEDPSEDVALYAGDVLRKLVTDAEPITCEEVRTHLREFVYKPAGLPAPLVLRMAHHFNHCRTCMRERGLHIRRKHSPNQPRETRADETV
jgi:hypothetical protein